MKTKIIRRIKNIYNDSFTYVYRTHSIRYAKGSNKVIRRYPSKVYLTFDNNSVIRVQFTLVSNRDANKFINYIDSRTFKNKTLVATYECFTLETFNSMVACANNYYNNVKHENNSI